jgi:hypothetical protein
MKVPESLGLMKFTCVGSYYQSQRSSFKFIKLELEFMFEFEFQ